MNDFIDRPLKEGDDVVFISYWNSNFHKWKVIWFFKDQAIIEWGYPTSTYTYKTKKIQKFIIKI